ncbi:protein DYAD-like [Malus sylvestris]|uniref:protein DYAD-like n=1 Tax=Malus sylvestris TaxID=3752 RepID=UPI0021ACDFB6|nr:protein DYAD-like [Malus sylvestris]
MSKYLGKKQVQKKPESKSTFLATHALLSSASASPSSPVSSLDAIEHIKVGCFYQMDQSKLRGRTVPEQLRAVRIVMVSAKGAFKLAVRFPSLDSLHAHISTKGYLKPDAKQIPALNEKYVMSPEMASEVLYRRIPPQEMVDRSNIWSFWAVQPPLKNHPRSTLSSPAVSGGGGAMASSVVPKKGPCWSELTFAGMVKWGKRRQIRYLRRHESLPSSGSDDEETEKGKEVMELKEDSDDGFTEKVVTVIDEDGEIAEEEDGEETEEEAAPHVLPWKMNLRSRKRKRPDNKRKIKSPTQKRSKSRAKPPNQNNHIVAVPDRSSRKLAKVKHTVARWSAGRYKLAEENMLKVMKEKGAAIGNPIRRPALRAEARRLIGDTGLLDHLLKHMAGKVAPGGTERFRRRHNADGAMEYWLESADLVHIRKEAGVQDPYWTPPPGWKPGDSPTQDPTCAREIKELREEIDKIRREMEESKQQGNAGLAMVTASNSNLTGVDLDRDGSLIQIKEACAELERKIAKMDEERMEFVTKKEEQMMEVTQSLSGIKEKIRMFESSKEDAVTISGAPPPSEAKPAGEKKEKDTLSGGDKAAAAAECKAAKIERLRSGFRICKPQGTFLWPDMGSPTNIPSPSSQILAPPHDLFVVPTPSSSSSSAPRPLISPTTPPVKPVAERRPVTTTTLCNVTTVPSSTPIVAPPPVLAPQTQSSTTVTISKTLLINLNELPATTAPNPNPNPQTSCEAITTLTTYHRRHHHHLPRMVKEEEDDDDETARNGDDQQRRCASPASTWNGEKWWMAVGTPSTSLEG